MLGEIRLNLSDDFLSRTCERAYSWLSLGFKFYLPYFALCNLYSWGLNLIRLKILYEVLYVLNFKMIIKKHPQ